MPRGAHPSIAFEDQNRRATCESVGMSPSCHKLNVSPSLKFSPYVVRGIRGWNPRRETTKRLVISPTLPHLTQLPSSSHRVEKGGGGFPSRNPYVPFQFSVFPRAGRNGADRARSGGLISLYRGCASGFFASETNHRFFRGQPRQQFHSLTLIVTRTPGGAFCAAVVRASQ